MWIARDSITSERICVCHSLSAWNSLRPRVLWLTIPSCVPPILNIQTFCNALCSGPLPCKVWLRRWSCSIYLSVEQEMETELPTTGLDKSLTSWSSGRNTEDDHCRDNCQVSQSPLRMSPQLTQHRLRSPRPRRRHRQSPGREPPRHQWICEGRHRDVQLQELRTDLLGAAQLCNTTLSEVS